MSKVIYHIDGKKVTEEYKGCILQKIEIEGQKHSPEIGEILIRHLEMDAIRPLLEEYIGAELILSTEEALGGIKTTYLHIEYVNEWNEIVYNGKASVVKTTRYSTSAEAFNEYHTVFHSIPDNVWIQDMIDGIAPHIYGARITEEEYKGIRECLPLHEKCTNKLCTNTDFMSCVDCANTQNEFGWETFDNEVISILKDSDIIKNRY